MKSQYTIVKFEGREIQGKYATFFAAAAALRKLSAEYFIQGRKRAWFFSDIQQTPRTRKGPKGINARAWFYSQSFIGGTR